MIPSVVDLLGNLFAGRQLPSASGRASLEDPNLSLLDPATWDQILEQNGEKSDSGLYIGPEKALEFGPVYQCCEIKSCDVATSTMHIHRYDVEPGQDDIDYNHPSERVCSLEWNEYTPANEGWQNLVFHQQLWGNGYAYIARQGGSPNGAIMWMANLVPNRVKPVFDDDLGMLYQVTVDGEDEFLYPWEVFHLRGLAIQNYRALSLIKLMRNELGLALGAKLYLSKFFERGGHHGGILMIPAGMQKEARENLEKGVHKRADPKSWFKTMILRDGAQWQSSTVDPKSAEMHSMTDDEARAVCHFFNMPPYKLGIRDSESYNSAEMATRAYITGSLLHTCTRIEGEAQVKFLSHRTRRARTHTFRHNFSTLLEPDVKTLNEVLAIQRGAEIINANEYRAKIRLPQRSDEKANEYYNPNTKSNTDDKAGSGSSGSGSDSSQDGGTGTGSSDTSNAELSEPLVRLIDESILRATRRILTVARNKSRKPNELLRWVDSKAAEHTEIVSEEVNTSFSVAFGEQKSSILLLATERWLMDRLSSGIAVFLESPHKPADLVENVESFCRQFPDTVCQSWREEVLNNAA